MLTADVAANFPAPELTVFAGLFCIVLDNVSMLFAVKYVEVYRPKIRRNGREARKV